MWLARLGVDFCCENSLIQVLVRRLQYVVDVTASPDEVTPRVGDECVRRL